MKLAKNAKNLWIINLKWQKVSKLQCHNCECHNCECVLHPKGRSNVQNPAKAKANLRKSWLKNGHSQRANQNLKLWKKANPLQIEGQKEMSKLHLNQHCEHPISLQWWHLCIKFFATPWGTMIFLEWHALGGKFKFVVAGYKTLRGWPHLTLTHRTTPRTHWTMRNIWSSNRLICLLGREHACKSNSPKNWGDCNYLDVLIIKFANFSYALTHFRY